VNSALPLRFCLIQIYITFFSQQMLNSDKSYFHYNISRKFGLKLYLLVYFLSSVLSTTRRLYDLAWVWISQLRLPRLWTSKLLPCVPLSIIYALFISGTALMVVVGFCINKNLKDKDIVINHYYLFIQSEISCFLHTNSSFDYSFRA